MIKKNQGSRVNSLKHLQYKTGVILNNGDMLWNSSKILVIYLEEKFRNTCLTGFTTITDQLWSDSAAQALTSNH